MKEILDAMTALKESYGQAMAEARLGDTEAKRVKASDSARKLLNAYETLGALTLGDL